jgi:hypothetical protein
VSLVGRFFGSRDDVPGWACFFDAEGYRAFLAVLDAEMKRRGLSYELDEGILRLPVPGSDPSEYGLLNLAQLCLAAPRVVLRRRAALRQYVPLFRGVPRDRRPRPALCGRPLPSQGPALPS